MFGVYVMWEYEKELKKWRLFATLSAKGDAEEVAMLMEERWSNCLWKVEVL